LNDARKHVALRSRPKLDWNNSTLIEGDPIEGLAAFAAQWAINAGHSQAVGRGRGQHDQTSDPEAGI
jgi:hypothetical protein